MCFLFPALWHVKENGVHNFIFAQALSNAKIWRAAKDFLFNDEPKSFLVSHHKHCLTHCNILLKMLK